MYTTVIVKAYTVHCSYPLHLEYLVLLLLNCTSGVTLTFQISYREGKCTMAVICQEIHWYLQETYSGDIHFLSFMYSRIDFEYSAFVSLILSAEGWLILLYAGR